MSKLLAAAVGLAAPAALALGFDWWSATLEPRAGSSLRGIARVEAVNGLTRATLDVQGAPRDAEGIGWAIHAGTCDALGAIHGDPKAYPPLVTDFTGETWEVATLTTPLTEGQRYSVVVHRAEDLSSPVAACGTLRSSG
ncbi:MAG: hypothetical protein ACT4PM_08755 [Gemmatimonadales bacterium]